MEEDVEKRSTRSQEVRQVSLQGPFKISCVDVFPHGLGIVSGVSSLDDFDASTKERRVQARDKDSGLPLWQVEVMDFDPDARERVFKVKIASAVQPVPPDAIADAPVRLVVLEGLLVMPYIREVPNPRYGRVQGVPAMVAKQAYSLRCSGLAAPTKRNAEHGRAA